MLLIACSAIITVSAESADNDQQKGKVDTTPNNVKALFYTIIKDFGDADNQVYSVYKNPETNMVESRRTRIFPWHSPLTAIATLRTGKATALIQRFCILCRRRKSDLTLRAALT